MTAPSQRGIFDVGDILNNTYRIEKVLGRGGTSEVYRARSEVSGRVVALKALRLEYSRNEDFLALMTREEDIREIRHDAIVRYYDNQRTDDGLIYLVMDYVEGPGLDRKIAEGGMSAGDLMIVAARVAQGLKAAHAKNIVHRDLSPDNIILRHGDPADAVIIDFGIAKDTNPGAETIVGNEFAGKYAYAAPEQLSGQTDARADIYALGALLLATFRGQKPDIGANPMEVVAHKAKPLDTEGVPEPLKTLIDRMTDPDREKRLQTADAVLAQINGASATPDTSPVTDDSDMTVIAPRKAPDRAPAPPAAPKPQQPTSRGGGTGIGKFAVVALLVLALVGVGGFFGGLFDGLLGPRLPLADPYVLVAQRPADGGVTVTGHVPSESAARDLQTLVDRLGGQAELDLARGEIAPDWGKGIVQIIEELSVLPEWRVAVRGNDITVTGTTEDPEQHERLSALAASNTLPAGLTVTTDIALEPRFLTVAQLNAVLTRHADCGPLRLIDPPATGYGPQTQIAVSGAVSDVATRVALSDALTEIAADRPVHLTLDTMNPTLCLVDEVLPTAPPGGFGITFRMGEDDTENTSGRFFVGENPVIDVTIPADVTDGYLFVSALDVSGNVFHLLPNLLKEDNEIASLRDGAEGPVTVRVAYRLSEAADGSKLAFSVDDSSLGKTMIVVIQADQQMFDGLRPTTESAGGYAEALKDYSGVVRTLDSRILTTAKP